MNFFTGHSVLRRVVALVLAAILSTGCMTWRPVPLPQSYLTAQRPARVWVSLAGGQEMDLYSPAVVVHDLIGCRQKGVDSSRVVIPMSSVRSVVVRQANEEATGWLIVTGVVVGVAVYAALSMRGTLMGGSGIGSGWSR